MTHNLEWNDVLSLIAHLGSARERHDGKYEFSIGGVSEVFTKPHHKDFGAEEIVLLRHFLMRAGIRPGAPGGPAPQAAPGPPRTVVLIDHHRARFFEASPQGRDLKETAHLEPKDPHGFRRHLEHRQDTHLSGQREPEAAEFYERIAERLTSAQAIVVIGDASGKSSAMLYLLEYLHEKHRDIAAHVVATAETDLSHISAGEIERLAGASS